MATKSRETRNQRWDFRVAESEDTLVRAASDMADTTITDFVREAALSEANRILADRRSFSLNEADWQRFNELLERPPQVPAGLLELFSKPPVFE